MAGSRHQHARKSKDTPQNHPVQNAMEPNDTEHMALQDVMEPDLTKTKARDGIQKGKVQTRNQKTEEQNGIQKGKVQDGDRNGEVQVGNNEQESKGRRRTRRRGTRGGRGRNGAAPGKGSRDGNGEDSRSRDEDGEGSRDQTLPSTGAGRRNGAAPGKGSRDGNGEDSRDQTLPSTGADRRNGAAPGKGSRDEDREGSRDQTLPSTGAGRRNGAAQGKGGSPAAPAATQGSAAAPRRAAAPTAAPTNGAAPGKGSRDEDGQEGRPQTLPSTGAGRRNGAAQGKGGSPAAPAATQGSAATPRRAAAPTAAPTAQQSRAAPPHRATAPAAAQSNATATRKEAAPTAERSNTAALRHTAARTRPPSHPAAPSRGSTQGAQPTTTSTTQGGRETPTEGGREQGRKGSGPEQGRKGSGPEPGRKESGSEPGRKESGSEPERKGSGPEEGRKESGPEQGRKGSGQDRGRERGKADRETTQRARGHESGTAGQDQGGRGQREVKDNKHVGRKASTQIRAALPTNEAAPSPQPTLSSFSSPATVHPTARAETPSRAAQMLVESSDAMWSPVVSSKATSRLGESSETTGMCGVEMSPSAIRRPTAGRHTASQWKDLDLFLHANREAVEGFDKGAQLRVLDLFSGTGSVADALRKRGFNVLSVDVDERYQPDEVCDIREWDYRRFAPGTFVLVAASPPCTEYSSIMLQRRRRLEQADELVNKAREIIDYLQPPLWWIENPRRGLLAQRAPVFGLQYVDIDYCRFSDWGYQKPTRFWCCSTIARRPSVLCGGVCDNMMRDENGNRRHRLAIGRTAGSPVRSEIMKIPQAVVEYLCGFIPPPRPSTAAIQERSIVRCLWPPTESSSDSPPSSISSATPDTVTVQSVCVRPWQWSPRPPFRIGRVEHRGGATQLLMRVEVDLDGDVRHIRVLVDTGAQVNLIRHDIPPAYMMRPAQRPLSLSTVSGEPLPGGQREVELPMRFAAMEENRVPVDGGWTTSARFYDAEISCDAILGYGWLAEQRLNILPWCDALQLSWEPRWILCSRTTRTTRRGKDGPTAAVSVVEMSEPKSSGAYCDTQNHKNEEEEEDLTIAINEVRKLQLELPSDLDLGAEVDEPPEALDDDALLEVARGLATPTIPLEQTQVRSIMVTDEEITTPLANELRAAILADYDGKVFRDRVWGNPPVRGPHGAARIYLKPGAKPVCGRTISLSGERLEAMRELEREWKADGKLEPGRSSWRAAAFPIRKKAGKWRGVVDYNRTNQEVQDDSYPLPRIEEILVQQGGCHIFSVLDIKDAFHQVLLAPESRAVTATQLPGGLFQWTVVPQGIKVGPPLLQRDVDATCAPVSSFARAYFDDICGGTKQVESQCEDELLRQHDQQLRALMDRLAEHRWVIDPRKCKLFTKRVEFCGHVLGNGRRRPCPGKLLAVQRWEPPSTVTALRAFLGLCNHYSTYVKMYAEYAAPLQEKLKVPKEHAKAGSKARVTWTPAELAAFERLKQALVEGLELYHVDPSKPFVLRTDASQYAIGAALEQFPAIAGVPTLEQILTPGAALPVAFMSRKLTPGQALRWDTRDKETYAVVSALEKWASWIGYQQVLIVTDHQTLQSWHREAFNAATGPSGRRARWHALLSMFRLEVVYVKGKDNVVPDALSRWAYPASRAYADISKHGSEDDKRDMQAILEQERMEERQCEPVVSDGGGERIVQLTLNPSPEAAALVAGVTTRSGTRMVEPSANTTSSPPPSQAAAPLESPSSTSATPVPSHAPPARPTASPSLTPARCAMPSAPVELLSQDVDEYGNLRDQPPEPRGSKVPSLAPEPRAPSQQPVVPPELSRTTPSSEPPEARISIRVRRPPERLGVAPAASPRAKVAAPPPSPRRVAAPTSAPATTPITGPAPLPVVPQALSATPLSSSPEEQPSITSPSMPVLPAMQPPPRDAPTAPGARSVLDEDWSAEYVQCPCWQQVWNDVNTPGGAWPTGYRKVLGKLLADGRWCVPTALTGRVLRAQHSAAGHVGGVQLWNTAIRHYQFAQPDAAYQLSQRMIALCEVCQACEHPHHSLRLPMEHTPIPPAIMSSVCIDLFQMPPVVWEGVEYDAFAACVDRHSGWVVATPHKLRGLTAAKVAKEMFHRWWLPHGIPSVVTSDNGAHFAGAWWRTLCALHGVRSAYAQAYHHAANGRAEVVGAQLQRRLRKLQAEQRICWVEALPIAMRQLHDVPGPSGLSPYEILYGRARPLAGVPYAPPSHAPDAIAFFERQQQVDTHVARVMSDLHAERSRQINAHRREPAPFQPGDKTWWLRPRGRPGEKLESYWVGPCRVLDRIGQHSYVIETRDGHAVNVHRCHLKPHHEDPHADAPLKLFHFKQAAYDLDVAVDEWEIERLLSHRRLPNGEYEFLVQWAGCDRSQAQWEPVGNFFHRYAEPFVHYCRSNDLLSTVNVLQHLAAHPPAVVAAVGSEAPMLPGGVEVSPTIEEWTPPPEAPMLPGGVEVSPTIEEWTPPPEDWPADLESAGPVRSLPEDSRPLLHRWAPAAYL